MRSAVRSVKSFFGGSKKARSRRGNGGSGRSNGARSQATAASQADDAADQTRAAPRRERRRERFSDRYKIGRVLGTGNFSVVKEAEDLDTGNMVAVKCVNKKKLSREDVEAIKQEVSILKALDHPHIIKLYDMYDEPNTCYVVTELVRGGELFDRIIAKEFYSEAAAAQVVKTIADALNYCNENGVVHRDLKPENVLLVDADDDSSIKLADFGFAKEVNPEGEAGLKTTCGTPGYVAPEIISGRPYGVEVDMWSLGVITYILLCGYPPFYDDNQAQLFRKIKKGKFTFDKEFWGEISDSAKDLVSSLLVVDPTQRLTAAQVLEHPWIVNLGSGEEKDITPALEKLRGYQARRRLKRGVNTIIAAARLQKVVAPVSASPADPPAAPAGVKA